jgi:dolichol-phosphate mannosyltransferase
VLDTVSWEVIFVDDDSSDGTAERIREISRRDRRVRCLQRIGRRGLTTACIEGALAASAPYIGVMDADMQHDEKLLPQMLAMLKSEPLDLVVGSRYVAGGGIVGLDAARANMSALATRLSRIICKAEIADPMSGFFMLRREILEGLSGAFPARDSRFSSTSWRRRRGPCGSGNCPTSFGSGSGARANSIRLSPGNT